MPFPLLILLSCGLLALSACESREAPPNSAAAPAAVIASQAAPRTSGTFLHTPIDPAVVEHAGAALPFWRRHREAAPTLVMISNDPFLQPVPEALVSDALQLLGRADAEEIAAKTSPQAADPLLRPSMAVSAALRAGFFSKVVWLLPTSAAKGSLSLETFRRQLVDYGAASAAEAATFELADQQFRGTIRGVPWEVGPYYLFSGASGPVVVHLDLGLIKTLYRNEVKTPLYPLLGELLAPLRQAGMATLATTLSLSQVTGQVPLDTRFIGYELADLIAAPQQLDEPLPPYRRRRSDILYLQNFFQHEKILAHYLDMSDLAPRDASVPYGLYQLSQQMDHEERAMDYLAQAVSLDPLYGLEYRNLSQKALHAGEPERALRLLEQAAKVFSEDPFLNYQRARLQLDLELKAEGLALLSTLQQLPWSPVYYAQLQQDLAELLEARQ